MTLLKLPDPRWLNFVRSCPDALPFQHPAWVDLLAECYGYRPLALTLKDDAGQIRAGVPVMQVGSPIGRRRWIAFVDPAHSGRPATCRSRARRALTPP